MAETEAQMMVELNKHLGEFRVNSARRFEEQKLHSQYMENQLLEMKEILISMAARYRVQAEDTTVVKEFSHGCTPVPISAKDPSHQVARHVLDEMSEPKEVSDSAAHQVFDETPNSENTIENDDTESVEQEESIRDEPIVVDELPHQVALQVLDEMPEFTDEIDLEIARVSSTEERHDLEVFGVSDLNHVTSLSLVENVAADLVRFRRKPPDQEEIVMGYIGLLCFDPGGGSLPLIDNSLGLERGGRDLLVTDSLKFELPLQEKCGLWCIDELLPEMTNAFQISLFGAPVHNPFNLESDQDKENIGLQNLVLETDMFGSVACFETFCFDPGGNSDGVLLERHIVDYELSEFVAWKLVEMEPENSAHYVVLSNLYAEMGRWADVSKVRGLMKERALMKAFEMYADKSLLQSEHMTEICFFAKNPSPQASKGDEMLKGIFLEVKKKFETAMGIIRREKITIDPNDPAAVQQWKGFITRTNFRINEIS